MPWISTNLSSFIKPVQSSINAFAASAEASVGGITKMLGSYDSKINDAASALVTTGSFLNALNEAGMYSIFLSPKTGGWFSRLSNAKVSGNMRSLPQLPYSTGMAVITMMPSLDTAAAFMTTLLNTLTSVIPDISDIEDSFDSVFDTFDNLLFDTTADLDSALSSIKAGDLLSKLGNLSVDEWKSLTMGDLLGGTLKGVAGDVNNLSKELKNVLAMKNKLLAKQSGIGKVRGSLNSLLSDMAATGAYCITLPPGPGKFLDRLRSEAGAPPTQASTYCCGMVSCAIGASSDALTKKWAALSKLG